MKIMLLALAVILLSGCSTDAVDIMEKRKHDVEFLKQELQINMSFDQAIKVLNSKGFKCRHHSTTKQLKRTDEFSCIKPYPCSLFDDCAQRIELRKSINKNTLIGITIIGGVFGARKMFDNM